MLQLATAPSFPPRPPRGNAASTLGQSRSLAAASSLLAPDFPRRPPKLVGRAASEGPAPGREQPGELQTQHQQQCDTRKVRLCEGGGVSLPGRSMSLRPLPRELELRPISPPRPPRSRNLSDLAPKRRGWIATTCLLEDPPAFDGGVDTPGSGSQDALSARPPVIRNVPSFVRPEEYLRSISTLSFSSQPGGPQNGRSKLSPIDQAIQRELVGDGMALDVAVESRRAAGWAVKRRNLQKSDLGHCCHGCRQPLRNLGEEVTIWTGAAIYRRFHPSCAASFVLRADRAEAAAASRDHVEGYADGWRALPEGGDAVGDTAATAARAARAARQWLLSQDPDAWQPLRGDLFTTITVVENGQKKSVPGLSQEQFRLLHAQYRCDVAPPQIRAREEASLADVCGECGDQEDAEAEGALECSICFGTVPDGRPCWSLPCAPQHVFHVDCVQPWLRKASLCPTCRTDLRPLLRTARAGPVPV
mmetsp:Transcript_47939/g.113959  ORF Transcript_47939/g.113959 Transcript_47939/m.113959 type:complete len:475 (+) Transcript_47939:136-1560(+)